MLVGDPNTELGEWSFSALVEADGHRILLDTGSHPETVLQNARDLKIERCTVCRERIGLTRKSAVVGSVGSTFALAERIHPGVLAK